MLELLTAWGGWVSRFGVEVTAVAAAVAFLTRSPWGRRELPAVAVTVAAALVTALVSGVGIAAAALRGELAHTGGLPWIVVPLPMLLAGLAAALVARDGWSAGRHAAAATLVMELALAGAATHPGPARTLLTGAAAGAAAAAFALTGPGRRLIARLTRLGGVRAPTPRRRELLYGGAAAGSLLALAAVNAEVAAPPWLAAMASVLALVAWMATLWRSCGRRASRHRPGRRGPRSAGNASAHARRERQRGRHRPKVKGHRRGAEPLRLAAVAGIASGIAELPLGLGVIAVTRLGSQLHGGSSGAHVAVAAGGWVMAAAIVSWLVRRPGLPGRAGMAIAFGLAAIGALLSGVARDVLALTASFGLTGLALAWAIRFRYAAMARFPEQTSAIEARSHRWSLVVPLLAMPVGVAVWLDGSWRWAAGALVVMLAGAGVFLALWQHTTPRYRDAVVEPGDGWRRVLLSRTGRWGLLGMFTAGIVFQATWTRVAPILREDFGDVAIVMTAGFVVIRLLVSGLATWAAKRAPRAPRLAALPGLTSLAAAALFPVVAVWAGGRWETLGWVALAVLAVEVGRQVTLSAIRVAHRPLGQMAALMGSGALFAGVAAGGSVAGWLGAGLAIPLLAIALVATRAVTLVRRRVTPFRAYILGDSFSLRLARPREADLPRADRDADRPVGRPDDVPVRAEVEPGAVVASLSGVAGSRDAVRRGTMTTTLVPGDLLLIDRPRTAVAGGSRERRASQRLTERTPIALLAFGRFPQALLRVLPRTGRPRPWLPLFPLLVHDSRRAVAGRAGRLVGIGVWLDDPRGTEYRYGQAGPGDRVGELTLRSPILPGASARKGRKQDLVPQ